MNRTIPILLALGSLAAPTLAAPQNPQVLAPVPVAASDYVALHEEGGQLYGFGNSYRALFHVDHVTFQPALGVDEPVTRNLHFTLEAAGRGAGLPVGVALERRVEGRAVVYDHGGLTEVYEVRGDGLKQSFVFATIPQGRGDLVVRCRLHSNMQLLEAAPERVVFGAERGKVEIGQVVCFDAAGMRANGSMQLVDGVLTMRLAEEFVSQAVAPLTIDPLVGTNLNVGTGSDSDPDCCFSASADRWLYVWSNALSANDSDVLGKFFTRSGSAISGSDVVIRTGVNWISTEPRVCHVRQRGQFVVTWLDDWYTGGTTNDVRARAVRASDGNLGSVVVVSAWTSSDSHARVAIGGNRTATRDDIAIGWTDSDQDTIEARGYSVASNGTLTANSNVVNVGFNQGDDNLSIADMDPVNYSFWLAYDIYTYSNQTSPGDDRSIYVTPRGAGMNNQLPPGNIYPIRIPPASANGEINTNPSISYSGNFWVIAWEQVRTPSIANPPRSIQGSLFYLSAENGVIYEVQENEGMDAGVSGDRVWGPEVALTRDGLFLSYLSDSGVNGDSDVYVGQFLLGQGSSLFASVRFSACETVTRYTTAGDIATARVASPTEVAGGTGDNERVMIASHRDGSTGNVRRRMFEVRDGVSVNLGGGCGKANNIKQTFGCANIGASTTQFEVFNAPAGQAMWLVIGHDRLDLGCGAGCTIVVNPYTAYIQPVTADADGEAVFGLDLPNNPSLQGMTFYQQWLMDTTSTAGCNFIGDLETSDCLKVTIQ